MTDIDYSTLPAAEYVLDVQPYYDSHDRNSKVKMNGPHQYVVNYTVTETGHDGYCSCVDDDEANVTTHEYENTITVNTDERVRTLQELNWFDSGNHCCCEMGKEYVAKSIVSYAARS